MSHLTEERLEILRSEYNHRNRLRHSQGKYPRQKMLPEYQFIYPWVIPDEQDPYFAFCTVCECRLSAKRSDLGKHEGSIKHTDNVSRKGIAPVAANTIPSSNSLPLRMHHGQQMQIDLGESTAESEQGCHGDIYIKQEPVVELVDNSGDKFPLEETRSRTLTKFGGNSDNNGNNNDEAEGDEYDEDDNNEEYVSAAKRRISETDSQSQHSSITTPLDCFPVQMAVGDSSSGHRFSIREIIPAGTYRSTAASINKAVTVTQQYTTPKNTPKATQAPCKITIKKITAPITPSTLAHVTSTARVTPVSGTIDILQHNANQLYSTTATTSVPVVINGAYTPASNTLATPPVRDSFDLFFDSICASVKALPPKLATEGKIRVMQLIGELELRAITERESEQNSAVASTTK